MSGVIVSSSVDELVERIAHRAAQLVVELLDERDRPEPSGLVDAGQLARLLSVSRGTVYEHWRELGGVRLGGERGRLRFDVETALEAWTRRDTGNGSQPPQTQAGADVRRRRRRAAAHADEGLLPVGGSAGENTQHNRRKT